jgi:hypothetical protein
MRSVTADTSCGLTVNKMKRDTGKKTTRFVNLYVGSDPYEH